MATVTISVENLTKEYRLGTINHGTLYKDIQSWWSYLLGNEDPNSLVKLSGDSHQDVSPTKGLEASSRFLALDNVSFDVQQGDVVGIIGRNGAGKSTLLKILSQVTCPTKGVVKLKGRVASLLEVGTGFHPELTGRENVFLNGAILGMNRAEIRSKFDEIVAFAEIEKFIDTPVKRYSSGMYVRLAFAVAAHLEPEILIVDEVLAVGDALFQKKCLGKMDEVGKEGRTILFVSHNLGAICQLCNKGIYLLDGKLKEIGDIRSVVASYSSLTSVKNRYFTSAINYTSLATIVSASVSLISETDGKYLFIIEFNANEELRNIQIGLGVNDKYGTRLTTLFSKFYDFNFVSVCGTNVIYCEVYGIPLKKSEYSVSIYLGNGLETFDYVHDAFHFEVKSQDFYPTNLVPDDSQGGVLVSQKWWGESHGRGN